MQWSIVIYTTISTGVGNEFILIQPGSGVADRIRVNGPYNSLLNLNPTNIFVAGEVPDGGDYNCSVCRMYSNSGTPTCASTDSRVATLVMVGSGPPALENRSNFYSIFVLI